MKKWSSKPEGSWMLPMLISAALISILGIFLLAGFKPTPGLSWPIASVSPVAGPVSVATNTSIHADRETQPGPDNDNLPESPDSTSDLDDDDGSLDDFDARLGPHPKTFSRNQSFSQVPYSSIAYESNSNPSRIYPTAISKFWTISVLFLFAILVVFWPLTTFASPVATTSAEGLGVGQTFTDSRINRMAAANNDDQSVLDGNNPSDLSDSYVFNVKDAVSYQPGATPKAFGAESANHSLALNRAFSAGDGLHQAPEAMPQVRHSESVRRRTCNEVAPLALTTYPDSASNLDDDDGGLDDLSANTSPSYDHSPALLSMTGADLAALRKPAIVPFLLFAVRSFYCLHQHLRERAPPSLEKNTKTLARIIPAHSATTRFAIDCLTLSPLTRHAVTHTQIGCSILRRSFGKADLSRHSLAKADLSAVALAKAEARRSSQTLWFFSRTVARPRPEDGFVAANNFPRTNLKRNLTNSKPIRKGTTLLWKGKT